MYGNDQRQDALSFGLSIPNRAVLLGVPTEAMLTAAERAEKSGFFNSVWVGDNLVSRPRLEAVVTLSAIASRTQSIRLGTICLASFPLRHPIELAVQWASLDHLSGGRTILTVCIGASGRDGREYENELAAMGIRSNERVPRLEEGIEILRLLWTGESVTYDGRFYNFEDITVLPKPMQQPMPIDIAVVPPPGGKPEVEERALRRVARIADGWQIAPLPYDLIRRRWERIQEYAEEYGRAGQVRRLSQHIMVNVNDDADRAKADAVEFLREYYGAESPYITDDKLALWLAVGPPDAVAEHIAKSVEAGVNLPVLRMASKDQLGQLDRCVADVMPLLTAYR